jgi:glycosyltransferase involved in cell wall biosynthesis
MNIIQIIPGKIWGGAEQYIYDLTKELIRQGHHVTLISRNSKAVSEIIKHDFPLTTLPFIFSLDLYSAYRLATIIRKESVEVIHIHDVRFVPTAILAKKWSGRDLKVILTRHIARASRTSRIHRGSFMQLHRMIFVSQLAQDLWNQVNTWMPDDKFEVITNSIPRQLDSGGTETLIDKFALTGDVPIIVFTGRVRKSKGCMVLLEAIAKIKKIRFHLIYIGKCKPKSYGEKLRKRADALGVSGRVSFYGFTNNARQLISQADIGVMPSIVREACPLSPMEFMQAGKCVIVTNNGAQREYIQNGETGILVPPNDVDELSNALLKVIVNEGERSRIGSNARQYFDSHLNYDKFYQKIIDCYK